MHRNTRSRRYVQLIGIAGNLETKVSFGRRRVTLHLSLPSNRTPLPWITVELRHHLADIAAKEFSVGDVLLVKGDVGARMEIDLINGRCVRSRFLQAVHIEKLPAKANPTDESKAVQSAPEPQSSPRIYLHMREKCAPTE